MPISLNQFWNLEFSAGGGPATRALCQRPGALIAYAGQQLGVGPNFITAVGLGVSLAATFAYMLLPNSIGFAGLCFALYFLAYCCDCADGQLARAHGLSSEFGAWTDISADAVQIVFLAFGILYWLAARTGGLDIPILLCAAAFAIGRVLILYSSKFSRLSSGAADAGGAGARSRVKWLIWLTIDTPTLLFLLCLLRTVPALLALYAAGLGVALALNAGYLGLTKLRRA